MTTADPAVFHKIYGPKRPRVTYYGKDFLDYVVMIGLSIVVIGALYGHTNFLTVVGLALCGFMIVMFVKRHGAELRVPLIVRRPQDIAYMLVYKLENLPHTYFLAVGLFVLENAVVRATPQLPHHVPFMRMIALLLFYIHFATITSYRTAILIDHLRKKALVREVLRQTPWQRVVNKKTNITLEIVHAYCTGLLTHIVLVAPWYLILSYSSYSVLFLPVTCIANLIVEKKWLKAHNAWFYRDHWVGHNSELEFLFLHGTHHDAIPCGLIGAAEHGFLEGFFRATLAFPDPFYNPLIAAMVYTVEIKQNIELHQYIPGIFPRQPRTQMQIAQHCTHHYGPLEPYSLGVKLDQPGISEDFRKEFDRIPDEIKNSIKLDEELTGFRWDNPTYRRTLTLWDRYQT